MTQTYISQISQQLHPICFLLFSALLYIHPQPILAIFPIGIAIDYLCKQWLKHKERDYINTTLVELLALYHKVDEQHTTLTATAEQLNKNIVAVDTKLRSIQGWNT